MLSSGKCKLFLANQLHHKLCVFLLFCLLESINYVAKTLNGGNDRSTGKGNPRVNPTRAALFVETTICGSERFLVSCGAQSERFIVR